ncbi:protein ALP1-like [Rutidosis leptorrhynchoides]|uniref:protein ALP1-like n=1 Tax=Rutidosis leptorrhynchoides TaxID=125765 RepID=UPI003A993D75
MKDTYKMLEFLDDEKIVSFINSLTEEEVDGEASSSRFPRSRSRVYIARDREDAAIREYLRKPIAQDIDRLYNFHEQKHGLPGSNNDINVLNASPIFNSIKDGTAPPSPFDVNGRHYERGYYLGDGIYPDWAMLVKAPHNPIDEPRKKFKRFQESARKDIERAFGVLQGRFAMLKTPARSKDFNKIRRHMHACIVLHNMIQENNGFAI